MRKKLNRNFYIQPTLKVAEELLGKYIVRKIGNKKLAGKPRRKAIFLRGKIIETEAYIGPKDRASHAFGGKVTLRNKAEYLIGGHIYIYLVYGMYWQMNVSTGKAGKPECILIRALEPVLNNSKLEIDSKLRVKNLKLTNGPGKVCRWLKLDKSFYAEDLTKSKRIWLEDRGEKVKSAQILATKRIGIDYSGPYWSKIKWRFLIEDCPPPIDKK